MDVVTLNLDVAYILIQSSGPIVCLIRKLHLIECLFEPQGRNNVNALILKRLLQCLHLAKTPDKMGDMFAETPAHLATMLNDCILKISGGGLAIFA